MVRIRMFDRVVKRWLGFQTEMLQRGGTWMALNVILHAFGLLLTTEDPYASHLYDVE
jgi:hypothetical protein